MHTLRKTETPCCSLFVRVGWCHAPDPRDKNVKLNVTYDGKTGKLVPRWVQWHGKAYRVREVGKIYTERNGIAKTWCYGIGSLDMLIKVCHSPFSVVLEATSYGLPD